jgi:hypothetical protein
MFSNSNSFGAGTNVGFKTTYEQDKEGNAQASTKTNQNPKTKPFENFTNVDGIYNSMMHDF